MKVAESLTNDEHLLATRLCLQRIGHRSKRNAVYAYSRSRPTAEQALLEAQCYLSLQQNCSRCSYRRMDVVVELLKMNVGDDGVAASDVEEDELGQQSFANDDVLLMTNERTPLMNM